MWFAAGKWASRITASSRIRRLPGHKRAFLRERRFAPDKRYGVRRQGRWISSRKPMFGLRGCQSWARESGSWKRRDERWDGKRKGIVVVDCGGRTHEKYWEDAIGVRRDSGVSGDGMDCREGDAV